MSGIDGETIIVWGAVLLVATAEVVALCIGIWQVTS